MPAELAGPLARLAVLGLAELSRRGGSLRPAPGIAALLRQLDAAASGRAESTIGAGDPFLVTVAKAAEAAGVSPRRVRQLAASNRLRCRRHGREWAIELSSAKEYGREHGHGTSDDD